MQKVSYQNSNYNYDESYEDNGHNELHIFRKWKSLSLTCSHKGAYKTKHRCESLIKLPIASISVQKVSNQNSNYNYDESYEDSGNNEFHIFKKWKSLSLTCSHEGAYETEH